jgi:hypothetical protein
MEISRRVFEDGPLGMSDYPGNTIPGPDRERIDLRVIRSRNRIGEGFD